MSSDPSDRHRSAVQTSMFAAACPLILASASPRRRQLLQALGLSCECIPADIDESSYPGEEPAAFAERMAQTKAATVAARQSPLACVIGADTVVTIGGRILGKPKDHREALDFLELLNGKTHTVITSYALQASFCDLKVSEYVSTCVHFGTFTREVLQAYAQSKEPLDKAGAYAIQGGCVIYIKEIRGEYSNVVGLPVARLYQELSRMESNEQSADSE